MRLNLPGVNPVNPQEEEQMIAENDPNRIALTSTPEPKKDYSGLAKMIGNSFDAIGSMYSDGPNTMEQSRNTIIDYLATKPTDEKTERFNKIQGLLGRRNV